jgi:hypothetical protein
MKLAWLTAVALAIQVQQAGPPLRPRPSAPGAISGRITDADGKPVAGIEVRAMRRMAPNGVLQLVSVGGQDVGVSDADGKYFIANREPGDYLVVAFTHGRVLTPKPSLDTVRLGPPSSAGPDGVTLGYVITFFPGTPIDSEATPVTVTTADRTGTDIRLSRRPVFELTGSISGSATSGPTPWVTIAPASLADHMGGLNVRRVRLIDGRFSVPDLPAGAYVVSYRGLSGWAESTITIAATTPAPVVLELRPDRLVSGRVEFTGATPPPVIPAPSQVRPDFMVELRPAVLMAGASFTSTPIGSSLTFSTRAGGSGGLALRVRVPAPWVQVAGYIDGVDTLDVPYTGAGSKDALIVIADRRTGLQVSVRDAADRPAPDATVILFSEDPRYWVRSSRRAAVLVATGGSVTMPVVPPGRYFITAVRGIPADQTVTTAFIESVKARALPLEIAAGENRSVTLKVN